jgi:hypothetical protein
MKKILVALAASSCLVAAAPAMAQTKSFTLDINAFDFSLHGTGECSVIGSFCYGNTLDGSAKDLAYGNTTDLPIAGLTFDFGTGNIVFPGDQMDLAIWVDNGADGQFYHLIHTLQYDNYTGQNDIPGWNLLDPDHVVRAASVTLKDTSPAPETATWAMMVIGFGLAGAAMRRRRSPTRSISFARG